MANKNGTLIIDESISEKRRNEIGENVQKQLEGLKEELSEREGKIRKRQDFFEGRHNRWTNVVGLTNKQQLGHILVSINYIYRFCQKVHQALTNTPPRLEIKSKDESNEVETGRAEAVETAIYQVLRDNNFFEIIFKRLGINQIRDADFALFCKVVEDSEKGRRIEITPAEDMLKILVGWDDAQGSSFSFIAFKDDWTLTKIKREFGYDAQPKKGDMAGTTEKGSHLRDQYGMFSTSGQSTTQDAVPSGQTKLPKAEIIDYWGYEIIENKVKVINIIFINRDMVQFVVTDYRTIPSFIGHSFITAGKPWSISFIDPLVDPQVELNDRTAEEGDLIRVGAHMKFLAVNMPDFDPDSVKPGSGQIIFIEGENADFRPLQMTISPFPSADYINRMLEHMFNIGIPKISLAAGTAPYTGRVGAIQYQPFADLINDLRIQWEIVMRELIKTIQQYLIDYFPESHGFMREYVVDPETGEGSDGDLVIREVEFDWENVLPLSRSDKVIDASTLRDRHAVSLHTYLKEAGFRNPGEEIKKLKKESADPELMAIMEKFSQFSKGATTAQIESQKQQAQAAEEMAETMGTIEEIKNQPTPKSNSPILSPEQNDGRRGVLSGRGTPTGQTASLKGNVANTSQNLNAKAGV